MQREQDAAVQTIQPQAPASPVLGCLARDSREALVPWWVRYRRGRNDVGGQQNNKAVAGLTRGQVPALVDIIHATTLSVCQAVCDLWRGADAPHSSTDRDPLPPQDVRKGPLVRIRE